MPFRVGFLMCTSHAHRCPWALVGLSRGGVVGLRGKLPFKAWGLPPARPELGPGPAPGLCLLGPVRPEAFRSPRVGGSVEPSEGCLVGHAGGQLEAGASPAPCSSQHVVTR